MLEACEEAVKEETEDVERLAASKLIRATFYILSKQLAPAFDDLNHVIETEGVDAKLKANALIKRDSLTIQQCQNPEQDATLSFADFQKALDIDPNNSDVYHHRGQVQSITSVQTKKGSFH